MKVYIVKIIQTDMLENPNNAGYKTEHLEGVFASEASAISKMEELHDTFRAFQLAHPEWDYIDQVCIITEQELIP